MGILIAVSHLIIGRRILCNAREIAVLLLLVFLQGSVYAQRLEVAISDSDGNAVPEAIIELILPEQQRASHAQSGTYTVDQVDKEFVPHVSAVIAGSEVNFPNSDSILHHVYSFSPARTFNIPLYGRGDNHDYFESFPDTGVVEIGCNIHDWMLAYIYIGETGLMAISGEDGRAVLDELPVGTYQVRIWHSRLAEPDNVMLRQVTLREAATTTLELQVSLQRDRRIRRAPSANGSRYK